MIWKQETVLVGQDENGNPVAFWRKHPSLRMDLMYLTKQVRMSDVERFGEEMYSSDFAGKIKLKINENKNN